MKILGIDVETTGLDFENDRVTEIGGVLWDMEKKKILKMFNWLTVFDDMPELSDEIIELTGITPDMLENYGVRGDGLKAKLQRLKDLIESCEAVCAHNAPFDKQMLEKAWSLFDIEPPEITWIDSAVDVPYPKFCRYTNLTYVAAYHGFVNTDAHRAFYDADIMMKVVSKYDISEVIKRARSPRLTLIADCKKPWEDPKPDGEKDTDIAKAHGFRFNGTVKTWEKRVLECDLDKEREAYKGLLPVRIIKDAST